LTGVGCRELIFRGRFFRSGLAPQRASDGYFRALRLFAVVKPDIVKSDIRAGHTGDDREARR
jgi:hypothetical protein